MEEEVGSKINKGRASAIEKDLKFVEKIKQMGENAKDRNRVPKSGHPVKRPFKDYADVYEKEH